MTALIAPLLRHPTRHLLNLARSPRYRSISWLTSRYGRYPSGIEKTLKVSGLKLLVPDVKAFLWDYRELFYREIYKFTSDNSAPRIIDCGANIGVSVLYFKRLFPKANILAFEADKTIYRYLKHNLETNGASDVDAIAKAVWSEKTTLSFSSQGGDAGRIDAGGDNNLIRVETVTLAPYLNEKIDLLKIDVEGAELEVLKGAGDGLKNVERAFVEYHSFGHKPQCLHEILTLMADFGFRVHICPEYCSDTPFVERPLHARMDLRLNMFFIRE